MIKELRELNEQFYILCSRLDKYCEKLSDEQYAYMQDRKSTRLNSSHMA